MRGPDAWSIARFAEGGAGGLSICASVADVLGSFSLDLFVVLLGGADGADANFAHDILHQGPRGLGMLRAAPAVGAVIISLGWRVFRCAGARDDGCLFAFRSLARPPSLSVCRTFVACLARWPWRGGRHDQRHHSRLNAATGHAAGDARTRQRGELAVYWRIQRAGRV